MADSEYRNGEYNDELHWERPLTETERAWLYAWLERGMIHVRGIPQPADTGPQTFILHVAED